MTLVVKYLAGIKELIRSYPKGGKFTLVSGNQSADLDSVISAISYAFLASQHEEFGKKSSYIPLVNIPRDDLTLRRDIEFVLKRANIEPKKLIFTDDIDEKFMSNYSIDIVLLDHNNPQGPVLKELISNRGCTVTAIIDHHADEGLFLNANPRVVKTCGSCSSLVLNYWRTQFSSDLVQELFHELKGLITAPILVDTANLTHRVEDPDVAAIDFIKTLGLEGAILGNYFGEISTAKSDVAGLSVRDILRKDYKEYEIGTKSLGNVRVGISSAVKPFTWFVREYGSEELAKGVDSWRKERCLQIHMTMSSFVDETDAFHRELEFFSHDEDLVGKLKSALTEKFDLKPFKKEQLLDVYSQLDLTASRKQVAPAVQEILEAL
ncbi:unnamed protein product [Kuraishia capsulata CBS 1993]|uniref:DHHA2 domain-containing protein n=1 Tax=Kuraishia capsulata CBS 1993 TaxID=1382522 RepID=W6MTC2_9ASCO|nr:uncharacterized protein KUCA_T00005979001 [Kuraishia capsulata CBS 1993]CDK29984.1 unnamed protein product [Kuraishia capsulata CBS 1993]